MILRLSDLRSELAVRLRQSGLSTAQKDLWLNLAQDRIALEHDLPNLEETTTFSSVASTRLYYVESDFQRVVSIMDTTNDKKLYKLTEEELEAIDPDRGESGTPTAWAIFGHEYIEAQPTSASTLSVTSTSTSDLTQTIHITGIVSGEVDNEQVTLNGTTAAVTTKSFTTVHQVVKSATTLGRVSVTSNSGAVTIVTIAPNDLATSRQPIFLYPVPSGVVSYRVRLFRRPRKLVNANDLLDLPPQFHELALVEAVIIGHESMYNFDQAAKIRAGDKARLLSFLTKDVLDARDEHSPVIGSNSPSGRVQTTKSYTLTGP